MNTKLLGTFAVAIALAAVGALAVGTVMVGQQASAGGSDDDEHHGHHGCDKHSNGFEHSNGKCFHRD